MQSKEVVGMSMLTVRNLDPEVKVRLQRRAAHHGRSMEAEVREILAQAVAVPDAEEGLGQAIIRAFADIDPSWIPVFDRDRSMPREIEL